MQITVAEKLGVEHRGRYWPRRDAGRNLMRSWPTSPWNRRVSGRRGAQQAAGRALHIRPIARAGLSNTPRGQYGPGQIDGRPVPGYRQEPDVAPDSATETYVALQLFVDNWRWQDVPFFVRTGNRLPVRLSQACIQFKPVPHRSFPPSAVQAWEPNRLIVYITPEEGVRLHFLAKRPGLEMHLDQVWMRFSYREFFQTPPPDAYETLLLDVMRRLSVHARYDQTEMSWTVVQPILEGWVDQRPTDFPNYAAGQWGPSIADELLARGPGWFNFTSLDAPDRGYYR